MAVNYLILQMPRSLYGDFYKNHKVSLKQIEGLLPEQTFMSKTMDFEDLFFQCDCMLCVYCKRRKEHDEEHIAPCPFVEVYRRFIRLLVRSVGVSALESVKFMYLSDSKYTDWYVNDLPVNGSTVRYVLWRFTQEIRNTSRGDISYRKKAKHDALVRLAERIAGVNGSIEPNDKLLLDSPQFNAVRKIMSDLVYLGNDQKLTHSVCCVGIHVPSFFEQMQWRPLGELLMLVETLNQTYYPSGGGCEECCL